LTQISPPRISVIDGKKLRHRLSENLRQATLSMVRIVAYRFEDFDLNKGPIQRGQSEYHPSHFGPSTICNKLSTLAESGVQVFFTTRDPFTEGEQMSTKLSRRWNSALETMDKAGVKITIHPNLHAKVYMFNHSNGIKFYAVGSSNLTTGGMGFRWIERNIAGYEPTDYEVVEKQVLSIDKDRTANSYQLWSSDARRKNAFAWMKFSKLP